MASMTSVVELLGGERTLGRKVPSSRAKLIEVLRAGVPYPALESVMQALDISRGEVCNSLALPSRTLARRKKERKLRADESDRLFRLANVGARALEIFGTKEKAARWLRKPNRALAQAIPLALLDTDTGARQVEEVLGQIEYGLYSGCVLGDFVSRNTPKRHSAGGAVSRTRAAGTGKALASFIPRNPLPLRPWSFLCVWIRTKSRRRCSPFPPTFPRV